MCKFQLLVPEGEKKDVWWQENNRDNRIYREGHFELYDSSDDVCIKFGEFNKVQQLRNGEICVKTLTPKTKVAKFDGSDYPEVEYVEQIKLEPNHLMDYSYIGCLIIISSSFCYS